MLSHTQTTKEEKTYMGMGQHLVLLPSGNLLQFANWKMAIEIVIIVDFPIKNMGNTHPLTSYDSGYLKCPCFDSLHQEITCINLLMPRCLLGQGASFWIVYRMVDLIKNLICYFNLFYTFFFIVPLFKLLRLRGREKLRDHEIRFLVVDAPEKKHWLFD